MEPLKKHFLSDPPPGKGFDCFVIDLPNSDNCEEEICRVTLKPFSPVSHLSFDKVKIGTTKTCSFILENPLDLPQTVFVDKFPEEKGFRIESNCFEVSPLGSSAVKVSWTPDTPTNCRETVTLKTSAGVRTQLFLLGTAVLPKERARKTWQINPSKKAAKHSSSTRSYWQSENEEQKENINKSAVFNSETWSTGQNKESIFKPLEPLKESPKRRQTYTINSMLRESIRGSELSKLSKVHPPSSEEDAFPKKRKTWNLESVPEFGRSFAAENSLEYRRTFHVLKVENIIKEEVLNDSLEDSCDISFDDRIPKELQNSPQRPVSDCAQEIEPYPKHEDLKHDFDIPLKRKWSCAALGDKSFYQEISKEYLKQDSVQIQKSVSGHPDEFDELSRGQSLSMRRTSKWAPSDSYFEDSNFKFPETSNSTFRDSIFKLHEPSNFRDSIQKIPKQSSSRDSIFNLPEQPNSRDSMFKLPNQSNFEDFIQRIPKQSNSRDSFFNFLEQAQANSRDSMLKFPEQSNIRDSIQKIPKQSISRDSIFNLPEQPNSKDFMFKCPDQSNFRNSIQKLPKQSNVRDLTCNLPEQMNSRDSCFKLPKQSSSRDPFFNLPEQQSDSRDSFFKSEQPNSRDSTSHLYMAYNDSNMSSFRDQNVLKSQNFDKLPNSNDSMLFRKLHNPTSGKESFSLVQDIVPEPQCFTVNVSPPQVKVRSGCKPHSIFQRKQVARQSPVKPNYTKSGTKLISRSAKPKIPFAETSTSTERSPTKPPPKSFQRRLTLKKAKIDHVVLQRNPFSTANSFYDEYWMDKQESAFTNWLNFILTPNDDFRSSADLQVNSTDIWVASMKDNIALVAPSREELSFKTYTAKQELNQLRKNFVALYQSDAIAAVIKRVESEVDTGKIIVRKDRGVHADLGIKKSLLDMVLSYNTLWLRIGLETIYGEILHLKNNSDAIGLSRFIIRRFLSDPDIASKFSNPKVPKYFKPGYDEAIKRFILKKFLLLVYFLDVAKNHHLINHNPCLFCKNSKYKSSRDLLITFSKEYLSGEGDVTKHLRHLGCTVSFQQHPIEEFDFAVRNISCELRCGLRLGRVVELLLQDWTVFKMMRVNTLNRLTKIHNNQVTLDTLQKAGIVIERNIDAKDIVDGHREKTLDLLWQIIFKTQVSKVVSKEQLLKEIDYLKHSLKLNAAVAAFNTHTDSEGELKSPEANFPSSRLFKENDLIELLLQWCHFVCAHYGLKVMDYTSSFVDGRALCFIFHHYLPHLLPLHKIQHETSSTYTEKQLQDDDERCPFLTDNAQAELFSKKLRQNEKENLDIVFTKFQEIGKIPILSIPSHLSNPLPDEKVMVVLISYVNSRLLELSKEQRAALKIQLAWKRWKLRLRQALLKEQISAVSKIQKCWRKYRLAKQMEKEKKAAILLQSWWRMHAAMKQLTLLKYRKSMAYLDDKAIIIQAVYRGYITRKHMQKRARAAVVIQSYIRVYLAKKHLKSLKLLVLKIENNFLAKKTGKAYRQIYLYLKCMTTKLQASARGNLSRKKLKRQHHAARTIQSYVRMHQIRKKYLKLKIACICVQRRFRALIIGRHCRKEFQNVRKAAINIQRWYLAAKQRRRQKSSAVKIQSFARMYLQRRKFLLIRSSAVKVQSWWRSKILADETRQSYLLSRKRVILLQSIVRMNIAKKVFKIRRQAAIVIQKYARKMVARKRFCKMKNSAKVLHSWWRNILLTRSTRSHFLMLKKDCIKIQSVWRMFQCKKHLTNLRKAVSLIELNRIGKMQRLAFLGMKHTAITLQAFYRGYACRKAFVKQRRSAIVIQSVFRKYCLQTRYLKMRSSAVVIQRYYRSYKVMRLEKDNFLKIRKGFIQLQALYRARKCRQGFLLHKRSAVLIQAAFRSFTMHSKYLKMRSSAIVIQQRYRALIAMRFDKQKYIAIKAAATKLQALFRGNKCRKELLKQKHSAVAIQAVYKAFRTRKHYQKMKSATVVIQMHYRAYRLMSLERQKYLEARLKLVKLQALWRGHQCRKALKKRNQAAMVIQTKFRGFRLRQKYLKLKAAALTLQKRYQAHKLMIFEQQKYFKMRQGFIKFQAAFRGHQIRKELSKQKYSAVIIQATFRAFIARKKYLSLKAAAIKIQVLYRAHRLMYEVKQKYLKMRKGFIKFQALWRGYASRKESLKQKCSAVVIQAALRGFVVRKRYLHLRHTAIKLQTQYRAYKLMCQERRKYLIMKTGFTRLQALWKGCVCRKDLLVKIHASIVIQSNFRRFNQRKKYLNSRSSSIVIQRRYRAFKIMCSEKQKYQVIKSGFILMQALYRGHACRKDIKKKIHAAIVIQSAYKAFNMRKKYLALKSSAIVIQQQYRAHRVMVSEKQKYLKLRSSVVKIQIKYRLYRDMCTQRLNFLKMKAGFIRLQALYRSRRCRQVYLKKRASAVKIQAAYRRFSVRRKFLNLKFSTLKIQRQYQAYRIMCTERQRYMSIKTGFIQLQAAYRGRRSRKEISSHQRAAITIQAFYRSYTARKQYLKQKTAVLNIECFYQAYRKKVEALENFQALKRSVLVIEKYFHAYKMGRCQREKYLRVIYCCCRIQSLWRGHLVRKRMTEQTNAARIIQRSFRKWRDVKRPKDLGGIKAKQQRQWFVEFMSSLKVFQARAKQYVNKKKLSAVLIQSVVRMWLVRQKFRRIQAAIKIQSLWRGYTVRRNCSKKIIAARKRIHKANASPDAWIGSRTTRALKILLESGMLSKMIEALKDLDVCTRLSAKCCERLQDSGGVEIIVQVIISCNQSVPHQQMIAFCVNILLNLAKHSKTTDSVWLEEKSIDAILNLMKKFHDKAGPVFSKCCSLLWIFCQDSSKAQDLKEKDFVVTTLRSVHKRTIRKYGAKEKHQSANSSRILNLTRAQNRTNLRDTIEPDWLLGKHRRKEFTDSLVAITSLIQLMQLE